MAAVVGGLLVAACGEAPEVPYGEQVTADRQRKDQVFSSSGESPITPETREQFLPLAYFPVDESYRVPAMIVPAEGEPAEPAEPGSSSVVVDDPGNGDAQRRQLGRRPYSYQQRLKDRGS